MHHASLEHINVVCAINTRLSVVLCKLASDNLIFSLETTSSAAAAPRRNKYARKTVEVTFCIIIISLPSINSENPVTLGNRRIIIHLQHSYNVQLSESTHRRYAHGLYLLTL